MADTANTAITRNPNTRAAEAASSVWNAGATSSTVPNSAIAWSRGQVRGWPGLAQVAHRVVEAVAGLGQHPPLEPAGPGQSPVEPLDVLVDRG